LAEPLPFLLIRSTCIFLAVLVVGLLIGFRPAGTILNWGVALGLILLIDFLFIWFSAFLGLVLNSVEAVSVFITAVRGLVLNQPDAMAIWQAIAWCVGLLVVLIPLAVWAYGRRTARSA
jgi:hypothetical protein